MVEQFGLAIILSFLVRIPALISGTTNGTFFSMRQHEELSTTKVPASANFGAHSLEVLAPAEKIATSGRSAIASSKPITLQVFPLNLISFPTDFAEATG